MATSQIAESITLIAAEALTIYTGVFVNATGLAAECNAETDYPLGVVMETVAIGENVPVMTKVGAIVPLLVDGAHTAGDIVSFGAAGEGVTEGAAGEFAAGIIMETSTTDQDIVEFLFSPHRIHA
jgi:hypothetical protein